MATKIRFTVTAEHCARATDELFDMLLRQDRAFKERWYARRWVRFSQGPLRFLGLALSILGAVLCAALLVLDEHRALSESLFLLIFAAFAVVFYYIPRITMRLREALSRFSERSCRRNAERFTRVAAALAPYEAEYELNGDVLTYFRCKGDDRTLAWQRQLARFKNGGAALQAKNVTAIFRRPTSFVPAIVILQADAEWTRDTLEQNGIRVTTV